MKYDPNVVRMYRYKALLELYPQTDEHFAGVLWLAAGSEKLFRDFQEEANRDYIASNLRAEVRARRSEFSAN
jgi:hypothetical protein